jgi:hypothetical protein
MGIADASLSERIARSAPKRCTPPSNELNTLTLATITASATDPTAAEMPAPAASTGVNGLANSSMTLRISDGVATSPVSMVRRRRWASSRLSPRRDD